MYIGLVSRDDSDPCTYGCCTGESRGDNFLTRGKKTVEMISDAMTVIDCTVIRCPFKTLEQLKLVQVTELKSSDLNILGYTSCIQLAVFG